jgi:hypothetical protein
MEYLKELRHRVKQAEYDVTYAENYAEGSIKFLEREVKNLKIGIISICLASICLFLGITIAS